MIQIYKSQPAQTKFLTTLNSVAPTLILTY